MVMLVSWLTDRLRPVVALLAVAALVGPSLDAAAQQADPPAKRQAPQKAPAKPRATPAPKPGAAPPAAAKVEALPPSPIGLRPLAKQAFMFDPQTSTVLLFKDADKPMHPSSMARMMTSNLVFANR